MVQKEALAVRRFWILFFVLLFIFANSALAERTVYADQGGVAVFMEDGKVGLVNVEGEVLCQHIGKYFVSGHR